MAPNMQKEIRKELNQIHRRRDKVITLCDKGQSWISREIVSLENELARLQKVLDREQTRALNKLDRRIAILNGRLS